MKTWVRRSLNVGALTAGALLASGGAASAQPVMTSTDNVGAGNGTQVLLPIQAPVNLCGNAVGILGTAAAACEGGATALDPEWRFDHYRAGSGPAMVTRDHFGLGNGTQVLAPIQVPVNACGNAVAVLGGANASCAGGAEAERGNGKGKGHGKGHGKGGYEKPGHGKPGHEKPGHGKPGYEKPGQEKPGYERSKAEVVAVEAAEPTMVSSGNVGLLNGTQALIPVQLPIDICGNAIAVLGAAQASCTGGATATIHG